MIQLDVIVADLDGGSIYIPESLIAPVSRLPPSLWEATNRSLTIVLQPELAEADNAFPNSNRDSYESQNQLLVDKEIRAIFMRVFAQLMQGFVTEIFLISFAITFQIPFQLSLMLDSHSDQS